MLAERLRESLDGLENVEVVGAVADESAAVAAVQAACRGRHRPGPAAQGRHGLRRHAAARRHAPDDHRLHQLHAAGIPAPRARPWASSTSSTSPSTTSGCRSCSWRSGRRGRTREETVPFTKAGQSPSKVTVPKKKARAFRRGPTVLDRQRTVRVYEGGQYDLTLSSFLTSFTPVTDLATVVAADLAAFVSTKPDSCTTPSLVSTLIW